MAVAKLTAQERELQRKNDFLREVINRLQEAMGLIIQVEAHHKDKPGTKIVFEITLAPGVWEDAHNYVVIRDAIYATIKHHVETLLETTHNGHIEELIVKKTKKGF